MASLIRKSEESLLYPEEGPYPLSRERERKRVSRIRPSPRKGERERNGIVWRGEGGKGMPVTLLLSSSLSVHRTRFWPSITPVAQVARARRAQKAYVDNEENVIATLSTAYFHDVSTAQFTLRPFPASLHRSSSRSTVLLCIRRGHTCTGEKEREKEAWIGVGNFIESFYERKGVQVIDLNTEIDIRV